ncbi:hypothetical protein [Salinispora vitiensis]|uniref:hypothetical protein n=1 Tax=Salinispora vitiensis TaxID=999544 RepID=UPI0021E06936|nr:hypothetical protein [Salinispora vitiensis]
MVVTAAVCAVVAGYRSYTAIDEWIADVPAATAVALGIPGPASVRSDDPPAATGRGPGPTHRRRQQLAHQPGIATPRRRRLPLDMPTAPGPAPYTLRRPTGLA